MSYIGNTVNSVTQEDSITAIELADGSVNTAELINGAVTSSKLADNTVTSEKIVSGAVTRAKLASDAAVFSVNGVSGDIVGVATALSIVTERTSAATLSNKTIGGADNNLTADGSNVVGFRHIPQLIRSTSYTCVLQDAGKHILHPSADTTARTFTIPADSSVAFPIGSAITFINQVSAGTVTIAITTDIMRLAGAGTVGSRTLAPNGIATAIKLTATEWIISGSGLT